MFIEISEHNANSVNPDQTPRSAASDLGLHCLAMSISCGARLKGVKWLFFILIFTVTFTF